MPRKAKVERVNPNAAKHNTKFGWCTDGNHPKCRIKYTDWNNIEQECICECHTESDK